MTITLRTAAGRPNFTNYSNSFAHLEEFIIYTNDWMDWMSLVHGSNYKLQILNGRLSYSKTTDT